MPGLQKGWRCIQQSSRCERTLENRKSKLLYPYDNKQGQADVTHWQRVVRKRKRKAWEGEEEKIHLKGKIFSHLKMKKNLIGKKHMLGIGERNRKNGWKITVRNSYKFNSKVADWIKCSTKQNINTTGTISYNHFRYIMMWLNEGLFPSAFPKIENNMW